MKQYILIAAGLSLCLNSGAMEEELENLAEQELEFPTTAPLYRRSLDYFIKKYQKGLEANFRIAFITQFDSMNKSFEKDDPEDFNTTVAASADQLYKTYYSFQAGTAQANAYEELLQQSLASFYETKDQQIAYERRKIARCSQPDKRCLVTLGGAACFFVGIASLAAASMTICLFANTAAIKSAECAAIGMIGSGTAECCSAGVCACYESCLQDDIALQEKKLKMLRKMFWDENCTSICGL